MAEKVEKATTWRARAKGLLGRTHLREGDALLIAPCRQIHTFFMKFSIDVLFLDRHHRVLGVHHRLVPFRMSPYYHRAWGVLELAAGEREKSATEKGHRLKCQEEAPTS